MTSALFWSGLRRSERGGALAEAAIVLPILLLVIFAMVWFGMLLYSHIVVQIAAAQGARVGAAAYADDPGAAKTPTPDEKAKGFVRSVLQSGLSLSNLDAIEVKKETIEAEEALRVTVTYRFRLLVPFMSEWGASPAAVGAGLPIVKSSVYRVEVVRP